VCLKQTNNPEFKLAGSGLKEAPEAQRLTKEAKRETSPRQKRKARWKGYFYLRMK
jgi:hypothetical protein